MQLFVTDPAPRPSDVRDDTQERHEEAARYNEAFLSKIALPPAAMYALLALYSQSAVAIGSAAVLLGGLGVGIGIVRKSVARKAGELVRNTGTERALVVFGHVRAVVGAWNARLEPEAENAAFSDPYRLVQAVEAVEKHVRALLPASAGLRSMQARIDREFLERWIDGGREDFAVSESGLLRSACPGLDGKAPELLSLLEKTATSEKARRIAICLREDGGVDILHDETEPEPAAKSGWMVPPTDRKSHAEVR